MLSLFYYCYKKSIETLFKAFQGLNPPKAVMADSGIPPTADSPEIVAFASRMYDAARKGDTAIFEQALPAGLPPNMTNDKGDSLV